jgi:hypothetical protein
MPAQAPIWHHLDLYGYWLAQRGSRTMPARSDLNPGDIPTLLPYLMIIEKVADQYRYRLVGTAVVQAIGRDLTGCLVGSYVVDAKSAADVRVIYDRAFTAAHPVFATGAFTFKSGAKLTMSQLILPLSEDGVEVNMAVTTLSAAFNFDLAASRNWLKGIPVKVCDVTDVHDAEELKRLCREWEQQGHTASLASQG